MLTPAGGVPILTLPSVPLPYELAAAERWLNYAMFTQLLQDLQTDRSALEADIELTYWCAEWGCFQHT